MTLSEGMLRAGALTAREGRLELALHLPWYRSLPLSCLERITVTIDGEPARTGDLTVSGAVVPLTEAAESDLEWDIRDPLRVELEADGRPGDRHLVDVSVAIRIPYLQTSPGVPLVQRISVCSEVVAR